MNINVLLKAIQKECRKDKLSGDMLTTATNVADAVHSFLRGNSIGVSKESLSGAFTVSPSFDDAAFESLGIDAIISLVQEANVPSQYTAEATASIATMLHRAASAGTDYTSVMGAQSKKAENNPAAGIITYEDLLPQSVRGQFSVGTEAFGATSDKTIADLQVAMTVSLLKWHNTLTPRVLSNIPTAEPTVNYIREEIKIYNLDSETPETDKTLLDMYVNPSLISNELTKIIPLNANEVDGEVVADGILAFGKAANIIALGIDAAKFGHAKFNRTDIVADGVKLDTIRISIKDADEDADQFDISIPAARGRLTRANNALSTVRTAHIEHTAVLTVANKDYVGATSESLVAILGATGDKLVVKLTATPKIDIRNGAVHTMGAISVSAVSSTNGAADAATTAAIAAGVFALIGYTLDARYAEENMRKSNIATTTERAQLVYEIPQGRNFVLDVPMNGPTVDRTQNVANLHNVIRIGQDNVVLNTILSVLEDIGIATEAYNADPTAGNVPGFRYAAGGRVRPTFISDTLDMSGVDSFDDARRQDAIQGRVMTFLNAICQQILALSLFNQQLDGNSAPTFRVITSPTILGNIVGARPGDFQKESGPGVELTLKLSSGVVLECITSTFSTVASKIVIIPFLPNDPASELNFGHNRDYGTIVGSYTANDHGMAVNRLLANVRELPVPTNVIGAIVDVEGISAAVYRS